MSNLTTNLPKGGAHKQMASYYTPVIIPKHLQPQYLSGHLKYKLPQTLPTAYIPQYHIYTPRQHHITNTILLYSQPQGRREITNFPQPPRTSPVTSKHNSPPYFAWRGLLKPVRCSQPWFWTQNNTITSPVTPHKPSNLHRNHQSPYLRHNKATTLSSTLAPLCVLLTLPR